MGLIWKELHVDRDVTKNILLGERIMKPYGENLTVETLRSLTFNI